MQTIDPNVIPQQGQNLQGKGGTSKFIKKNDEVAVNDTKKLLDVWKQMTIV